MIVGIITYEYFQIWFGEGYFFGMPFNNAAFMFGILTIIIIPLISGLFFVGLRKRYHKVKKEVVSDYLKGTQLYRTLIMFSSYVFLIMMLVVVMAGIQEFLIPILIVLAVWVLVLWIAQREAMIRLLRKYAGKKVLVGTVDLEEDVGEVVELKIKRITPFVDLADEKKQLLEKLTEKEKDLIASFEKSKNLKYIFTDIPKEEVEVFEDKSET